MAFLTRGQIGETAFAVIRIEQPTDAAIAEAAELIESGHLVGMPTETVYGLAADATNDEAVRKIYSAKGRPSFNPLIAHCAGISTVRDLIVLGELGEQLAGEFWPGPLTLVGNLAPTNSVCATARAGLDSLAVRVPAHPVARALLQTVGKPLVAPSANPSGRMSPTLAEHVSGDFQGNIAMILDGGPSERGVESTILDVRGETPALLRPGPITQTTLVAAAGVKMTGVTGLASDPEAPRSPGQLLRHYAPQATLRLDASATAEGEALLGFGDCPDATLNLSPSGSIEEANRNLFAMLRTLDASYDRIAVAPIPVSQMSEALRDRLARAAKSH